MFPKKRPDVPDATTPASGFRYGRNEIPGINVRALPGGRTKLNQNKTSDPKLQDHNQKGLTLFPNWQGRPRRLLGARKRILAQHLLKRG